MRIGTFGTFLGEMQRHMSHEEEKKTFFAAARFFGLRPSEGQKNAENSPKAKTSLAKAKQGFSSSK